MKQIRNSSIIEFQTSFSPPLKLSTDLSNNINVSSSLEYLFITDEMLKSYYIPSSNGIDWTRREASRRKSHNMFGVDNDDSLNTVPVKEKRPSKIEETSNQNNMSNNININNILPILPETEEKNHPIFTTTTNIPTSQDDHVMKTPEKTISTTPSVTSPLDLNIYKNSPADSISSLFSPLDMLPVTSAIVSADWTVSEMLTVVEKGGKVDKIEVVGTLLGNFLCSETGGNESLSIPLKFTIVDQQLQVKSVVPSKLVQSLALPSSSVAEKTQWLEGQLSGVKANSSKLPLLRYTCLDSFKPFLLKARTLLTAKSTTEIHVSVQVIMNPKYSAPISNLTVQVSLINLIMYKSDDSEFKPDICYVTSSGDGRGGVYNSNNNIITFNCGLVNSVSGDNNPNKISLEADVTVDNKNNNNSMKLKNNSLPFIITGSYDNHLITNGISISCDIITDKFNNNKYKIEASNNCKLNSKVEFKFL